MPEVTVETSTLSLATDMDLGRPLTDVNWDSLKWIAGQMTVYNQRVLFRTEDRIYCVGTAPTVTERYEWPH